MHTSAYESCRIHHNGAYDGDIYITNEDSTSKPIGAKTDIRFSTDRMLTQAKKCRELGLGPKDEVVLKGLPEEGYGKEIIVLVGDIWAYVDDVIVDRIQTKLDRGLTTEKIIAVARVLNIRTDRWTS